MPVDATGLTPFQLFATKMLTQMLLTYDRQTLGQQAFKLTAKHLIRHYSEFDHSNRKYYQDHTSYRDRFRFTKRAWIEYRQDPRKPTYEHIWPIDATFRALLDAKSRSTLTLESVQDIMEDAEVIIISSEEAAVLNGSTSRFYGLDGRMILGKGLKAAGTKQERLSAVGAEIEPATRNNSIRSRLA